MPAQPQQTADNIIAVVDDDPAVRASLQFALEVEGFGVRVYPDAQAMLEAGRFTDYRCVIVDQNLPTEEAGLRFSQQSGKDSALTVTTAEQAEPGDEVVEKNGPVPLTPTGTPMYALIRDVMHAHYGDVPVGIEVLAAFTNDSRYLRARGIACYGMWPFEVDFFQSQGVHSVDERVRLDWFDQGVALMRDLVDRYAFRPLPSVGGSH